MGLSEINFLTFFCAVAVCDAIGAVRDHTRIKWPNDVMVGSKKLCGILTEASVEGENAAFSTRGGAGSTSPKGGGLSPEIRKKAASVLSAGAGFAPGRFGRLGPGAFFDIYEAYLNGERESLLPATRASHDAGKKITVV
jgi:BirA family biotin operon repressor/biotin-[acetyl-CoA-carboxylase] ligase